ncbi:MAG: alpha/beta hydrolase [Rhodospirillaceae bacterium]|nr:MAG: alpha/beta hydrolase [Rhodospirillaceae bacterium]
MMFATLKKGLLVTAATCCLSLSAWAEDIQIKSPEGLTLNANLTLADGKSLKDGVVILTHGTLAHNKMEIIVALQSLLAERDISSIAPTLSLGISNRTGSFDCAVPATHKHSDAMAEIGYWLDYVKSKGATDVVVAGHSRGGNQTAWFAAENTDPTVSKVVLIAPATWTAKDAAKGFKKTHGQDLSTAFGKATALQAAGKGGELMKGMGVLYCPGEDVTADSFVNYYKVDQRQHTPNLLPKIAAPVLVIVASADQVVDGLIEAVQPMVDGKKLQMIVVDEAGHFFLDFYVEDAADAMEAFIKGAS